MFEFQNITEQHMDILKEIGNIGSGHAVTALASMLNKRVNMKVPKINILPFKDISNMMRGAENLVVGILLKLKGDIKGDIMFLIEYDAARTLINMLIGSSHQEEDNFSEFEISALKEIGNIMASSYISALSMMTGYKITPSIPYIAIDMAGAIISVPAIEFGKIGDAVMYIETEFSEGTRRVWGDFFLMLQTESFGKLMNTLGVDTY
jgi:chemotaxis protein CheC